MEDPPISTHKETKLAHLLAHLKETKLAHLLAHLKETKLAHLLAHLKERSSRTYSRI